MNLLKTRKVTDTFLKFWGINVLLSLEFSPKKNQTNSEKKRWGEALYGDKLRAMDVQFWEV